MNREQALTAAMARHNAGDVAGAAAAYRDVLKRHPRDADALYLLAAAMAAQGNAVEALTLARHAVAARNTHADAHFLLATLLHQTGDTAAAAAALRRVLDLVPAHAMAANNLGALIQQQGDAAGAEPLFRQALSHNAANREAWLNLCGLLRGRNDMPALLMAATAGLNALPGDGLLQLFRGDALFAAGRLREGWHAYEARFGLPANGLTLPNHPLPFWRGEDLAGKSILVWREQSPGDEAMFAGMLGSVIAKARRVVFQCSPRLAALFRRSFQGLEIYAPDVPPEVVAGMDFQSPLGGLGAHVRPDAAAFPARLRYLTPDPARVAAFRAAYGDSLLVGLAWRSRNVDQADEKSLALGHWGAVLSIPGVTFVNLQYGDSTPEADQAAVAFKARVVNDRSVDPLGDLDIYAAQVAAMDLVITTGNTAAHIAGALGVATVCLLPDRVARGRRWYWFGGRVQSLWYPTVTIAEQDAAGGWDAALRAGAYAVLDGLAARTRGYKPELFLRSLASAYESAGRSADAVAVYDEMARRPRTGVEGHLKAAELLKRQRQLDAAMARYDAALALDPASIHTLNSKGALLSDIGAFGEAVVLLERALALKPDMFEAANNLATALRGLGRGREALALYRRALALSPGHKSVRLNEATTLTELGRSAEALAAFDRLIADDPGYVEAHYNRAQVLLTAGNFAEGWPAFAWRLRRSVANARYDHFPAPRWAGEPLAGKRVLIWTEQGIGDEILVASLVGDVAAEAAHVTLLCSRRLIPLMRRALPQIIVAERAEPLPEAARDPRIDFQMSFADAGAAVRRSFADFPVRGEFLKADPAKASALRQRYTARANGRRIVGISWRSANSEIGGLKTAPLLAWTPILQTPGVMFVNLQYGDVAADLDSVRTLLGIEIVHDPAIDPLADMEAAAAQAAAMDLVISVSNTTVHTAGALGVPTWMLLSSGRGRLWYWFRATTACPWYPTVRYFEQPDTNDWTASIAAVAAALRDEAS